MTPATGVGRWLLLALLGGALAGCGPRGADDWIGVRIDRPGDDDDGDDDATGDDDANDDDTHPMSDLDNDGYTPTDGDCYDRNADAFPGQTAFFEQDRGDGSFDYNCDDIEELHYVSLFDCDESTCTFVAEGWTDVVPYCSQSADWGINCYPIGDCVQEDEVRPQECR